MASMDIKGERNAPGRSVFWMIIGAGVVAVILLAVLLNFDGGNDVQGVSETAVSNMPVGDQPESEPMVASDTGAIPDQTGDTAAAPNSQGMASDEATVQINDDAAQN
ncbi:hypothetical protein C8N43_3805 [Litoreibacter ponti]|uniref:Uncharacterized protein n=1 Tax=Litoreibacter ponti TaxID=1510457 RepID=A0A2T6BG02_9RHOB|nr:hypothetical protein [Litoreibacter ponti]PTX54976.1 hypothetical protein C8N43_3805 [Litoreibacter ponti]